MRRCLLLALLILFTSACGSTGEPSMQVTRTPYRYPTGQPTVVSEPIQEQWFLEHFEQGMPVHWVATQGWATGQSSVLTGQREQTFRVLGDWDDLVIRARLRRSGEGWGSIGFREWNDNYLQLSFSKGMVILGQHKAGAVHGERIGEREMNINEGWHELEITAIGGHVTVKWNDWILFDVNREDLIQHGSIFVQNWDGDSYELDLLEVALPEKAVAGGSGSSPTETTGGSQAVNPTSPGDDQAANPPGAGEVPTDTPSPSSGGGPRGGSPSKVTDFSADNAYFDARGVLWASITNGGPDSFKGIVIIDCTIWYYENPPAGKGGSTQPNLILEPGQSTEVKTPCMIDPSRVYWGANFGFYDLKTDPNPTNNYYYLPP